MGIELEKCEKKGGDSHEPQSQEFASEVTEAFAFYLDEEFSAKEDLIHSTAPSHLRCDDVLMASDMPSVN